MGKFKFESLIIWQKAIVTGDITPEYLARLQAERSDLAKSQRSVSGPGAGRGPLRVVGGP